MDVKAREEATLVLNSVGSITHSGDEILDTLLQNGLDVCRVESYESKETTDLNQQYPEMLRQWIIEKMLETGALHTFDASHIMVDWADDLRKYITEGKSDD